MKPVHTFLLILVLLPLIFLTGCPKEENKTAILCTNRPEFTSYVELFNSSQEEYRIVISYNDKPRDELIGNGKCEFDLLIDSHLNSLQFNGKFASLENLFMEEKLDADRFYSVPFSQGEYGNQQVLLPISFQIPGLIFHSEQQFPEKDSFLIDLEQLENLNNEFSTKTEKGFTKLGLSLRWEPYLLYLISLLKETNFHESKTGTLVWNSQNFRDSVELIRKWTFEINDGLTSEREFTQKFLIEPPYKLIADTRILCYYADAAEFYSISSQKREELTLRWLAEDELISVLPDVLFAGIPQGAPGIEAAKAFLAWFSNPDTQKELLASSQYKRTRTFAIAGGFSALPKVNEQILPTFYPSLVGFIPSASYFRFPKPMPPNWPMIRDQVIIPWLEDQAASEKTEELMRERLEIWLRQKPSS